MDTMNTYNKLSEPKIVDTVNVCGKYVDASAFKSKIITASATTAFLAAIAAFFVFFF
jgi:hypothetical protein